MRVSGVTTFLDMTFVNDIEDFVLFCIIRLFTVNLRYNITHYTHMYVIFTICYTFEYFLYRSYSSIIIKSVK